MGVWIFLDLLSSQYICSQFSPCSNDPRLNHPDFSPVAISQNRLAYMGTQFYNDFRKATLAQWKERMHSVGLSNLVAPDENKWSELKLLYFRNFEEDLERERSSSSRDPVLLLEAKISYFCASQGAANGFSCGRSVGVYVSTKKPSSRYTVYESANAKANSWNLGVEMEFVKGQGSPGNILSIRLMCSLYNTGFDMTEYLGSVKLDSEGQLSGCGLWYGEKHSPDYSPDTPIGIGFSYVEGRRSRGKQAKESTVRWPKHVIKFENADRVREVYEALSLAAQAASQGPTLMAEMFNDNSNGVNERTLPIVLAAMKCSSRHRTKRNVVCFALDCDDSEKLKRTDTCSSLVPVVTSAAYRERHALEPEAPLT